MKSVVLYFSRTGNSKRIAQKIADRAGVEIAEISDDKKWGGIIGFIRGGFYSVNMKTTNPSVTPAVDLNAFDKVIFVSPMWASNVAPAVYSYIKKEKDNIKELHLLINSGGIPTDDSITRIETSVGKPDYRYSISARADNEEAVVNEIVKKLQV